MRKVFIVLGIFILLGAVILLKNNSQLSEPEQLPTPLPKPSLTLELSPTISLSEQNIQVTSPQANTTVGLPLTIKGKARVFENQFNYRVRDASNNEVAEGSAYANSPDTGQFGPFSITITTLPQQSSGNITVEVFNYSAKDGSEENIVRLPLVLSR